MPATATLVNSTSTAAFTLPGGSLGVVLWSTAAAALRVRFGKPASASGEHEGIPIAAGSASDPKYLVHYFDAPLSRPMAVHIYQNSGGDITSGVGYDTLND